MPQLRLLKLTKEIDLWGKSCTFVKMLQPMKVKDSGEEKIKVWMCSMDTR